MQHEITKAIPLLDANGNLTEPGWARSLLPVYRRADIRAGKLRIKEWDYYLISNGRFALALTIADNGYMGMDSVSIIELEEGWEITTSPMSLLPLGKLHLPEHSGKGVSEHAGKDHKLKFTAFGDGRRVLSAHMDRFGDKGALDALIELVDEPEDSMVIATPFSKPKHFYYNQKINCMRAKGWFTYGGQTWHFSERDSFAVLDWGRGVWTYHNTWYWGSASWQVDGVPFGWNPTSSARCASTSRAGKRTSSRRGALPLTTGASKWTSPRSWTAPPARTSVSSNPTSTRSSAASPAGLCSTTARSSRSGTFPALPKRSKTSGKSVLKKRAPLGTSSVRKAPRGFSCLVYTSTDLASLGHLPLKGKA